MNRKVWKRGRVHVSLTLRELYTLQTLFSLVRECGSIKAINIKYIKKHAPKSIATKLKKEADWYFNYMG